MKQEPHNAPKGWQQFGLQMPTAEGAQGPSRSGYIWLGPIFLAATVLWCLSFTVLQESILDREAAHVVAKLANDAQSLRTGSPEVKVKAILGGKVTYHDEEAVVRRANPKLAAHLGSLWTTIRRGAIEDKVFSSQIDSMKADAEAGDHLLTEAAAGLEARAQMCTWAAGALFLFGFIFSGFTIRRLAEPVVVQKLVVSTLEAPKASESVAEPDRASRLYEAGARHFDTIFESLPVPCCGFASDGTVNAWNRAMEELTGKTSTEALMRPFWEAIGWSHQDEVTKSVAYRLFEGEPVQDLEWTYDHPAGESLELRAKLIPIRSPSGSTMGAAAAVTDATQGRALERLLLDRDVMKTALLAMVPDTVLRIDALSRLLEASDNAGIFDGRPNDTVGTHFWTERLPEGLGAAILESIRSFRSKRGPIRFEFSSLQDGLECSYLVRVAPCGSSDFLATIRDNSDKAAADKVAERSGQVVTHILAGSAEVVFLLDKDGRVTFQAENAGRWGYYDEQMVGRLFEECLVPEDCLTWRSALERMADNCDSTSCAVVRHLVRDGEPQKCEILIRDLLNNESLGAIVLHVRDLKVTAEVEAGLREEFSRIQSEAADLRRYLAEIGRIDPLTKLENHRSMREFIDRQEGLTTLALVAVVGLDQMNKETGYVEGDKLLQSVAEKLKPLARGTGMAARWSGHVFGLCLPHFGAEAARVSLERWIKESGLSSQVRIGLAAAECGSTEDLVALAVEALDQAKKNELASVAIQAA